MKDLLFHIDARRIHGQVVAGWGHVRQVRRFLLADDEIAADDWERRLYQDTPGAEFETHVLSIAASVAQLRSWSDGKRTMLIVGTPANALRILQGGIVHDSITLGNLDPGAGKRQLAPSVAVSEDERRDLAAILQLGVKVVIQSVPSARPIDIAPLLSQA